MKFRCVESSHLERLNQFVSQDRISTGESVLNLHARDQSLHRPCPPEVVIWPESAVEVAGICRYANENGIPVTGWGSGSSLEGNPIPVKRGIVLNFERMNRILDVRAEDFQVDVQPGVVYQDLNQTLKTTGLFFPPDPGARATVGGMIANNASGTRTVYYGSTKDYVLQLKMVLANGEIIETGTRASKSSSGYDLIHLFVGSEGTLGIVVQATLRLVGRPAEYCAVIATFETVSAAGQAVSDIVRTGLDPAALELLGPECIELMNSHAELGLPPSPTLFMEFHGATRSQLNEVLELATDIARSHGATEFRQGLGRTERDRIFKARHALGEMITQAHPRSRIQVMDVAVPNTAYPEMVDHIGEVMAASDLTGYTFGHAGDGNMHLNIIGPKKDPQKWEIIAGAVEQIVSKTLAAGGTATGEHGVGLGKRKFMVAEHGDSLAWMQRIKSLFDPNGILNPGKIFP